MPPKKKRTVKKSEAAVDPPPSTVDPEATTDGDDAEVPASNTQGRKNRKKPKKPTPAKRAAQLAAVKAAFKDQALIKTKQRNRDIDARRACGHVSQVPCGVEGGLREVYYLATEHARRGLSAPVHRV